LDNIIPVLNERADYYATILTGDEMSVRFSTKSELADGSTKEKFSIRVEQRHGGSSYGSNSEGEKSRANLAIALAISDLASLHSHKSIDFRFCDEVFDKLDQAGQAAVMKLLQVLKDKYPTVMVVTHQDSFKELFQNTIQVTKYNGISTLEEV
jgi:DNA repair exonuclease SbcCD ATPase subunit